MQQLFRLLKKQKIQESDENYFELNFGKYVSQYNELTAKYLLEVKELTDTMVKELKFTSGSLIEFECEQKKIRARITDVIPAIHLGRIVRNKHEFGIRLLCRNYNEKGALSLRKIAINLINNVKLK